MKYGRIFDYRNRDEAEIGKEYAFSNTLMFILDDNLKFRSVREDSLSRVTDDSCPFEDSNGMAFQFIREIIDEPKLMTNRQLAELIAKGYGQQGFHYESFIEVYSSYNYLGSDDDTPVGTKTMIRPWGSSEWVRPTVDIYNDFCHPKCKEDS